MKPLRFKPTLKRVLSWYHKATPAEHTEGAVWYAVAREQCLVLSHHYGQTLETVAGVVSALSPRVRWELNLVEAEYVLQRKGAEETHAAMFSKHTAFRANVRKAHRILNGEAPDAVLRGPKVISFYRTLVGVPAEPVLDTIAVLAATLPLTPFTAGDDVKRTLDRPRDMRTIGAAYKAAAAEVGLAAHQVQAIVWVTYRNERDAL